MKKILLLSLCVIYGVLFYIGFEYKTREINVTKDNLYLKIQDAAELKKEVKIESKFDPIFKRVPGLNGIEVDVEKSYAKMKKLGDYNEKFLVYKQIPIQTKISDLKMGPIYRGNSHKRMVTININLAWGAEYVEEMLAILKKHDIRVNFFVEGNFAKNNESLIRKIDQANHVIGNHSYKHSDFGTIAKTDQRDEINKTNAILAKIIQKEIKYFGPPSGAFNQNTIDLMNEFKMNLIMWDVDTIDWQNPSVQLITKRVLDKVDKGSIILMHPTQNTVKALENILIEIQKKGLVISTLDDLLSPINTNFN